MQPCDTLPNRREEGQSEEHDDVPLQAHGQTEVVVNQAHRPDSGFPHYSRIFLLTRRRLCPPSRLSSCSQTARSSCLSSDHFSPWTIRRRSRQVLLYLILYVCVNSAIECAVVLPRREDDLASSCPEPDARAQEGAAPRGARRFQHCPIDIQGQRRPRVQGMRTHDGGSRHFASATKHTFPFYYLIFLHKP